ncbi:MAG TPA: glycosyltransferase [Devosia sp.]|nr:glycosyltransferase [Devosia sp.]
MASNPHIEIVCFNGPSGLGDYSASLARAASVAADITISTSAPIEQKFAIPGAILRTPFRRVRHYPVDIWKFVSSVLASSPHVLLFQSWLYFPFFEGLLVRLFRLFGHRLFVTVHDTMPHHPKPWSRFTVPFFFRGFDGLIAHSPGSTADLRRMGVTTPIAVIPHATYDMFNTRDLSKDEARRELGIPADNFVVLMFGHIDERKGCFTFLEAARETARLDKVLFLVAGRNDLPAGLRSRLDGYRDLPNVGSMRVMFHSNAYKHTSPRAISWRRPISRARPAACTGLPLHFGGRWQQPQWAISPRRLREERRSRSEPMVKRLKALPRSSFNTAMTFLG